jgi:hypothetical protein
MLPGPELTDQFGEIGSQLLSLKIADAVNCPELFAFIEVGPLIARELKIGATLTTVML